MTALHTTLVWLALVPLVTLILLWLLGVRYIPHNRVGVVEKLWSPRGSLEGGRLIALGGEAGFQAEILRGGLHVLFFPWQYRLHKVPLVVVSEGKIAYVYARTETHCRRRRRWARSSATSSRTRRRSWTAAASAAASARACAKAFSRSTSRCSS
jgi:hypothetical protein